MNLDQLAIRVQLAARGPASIRPWDSTGRCVRHSFRCARHFARAYQADRCINLLHCVQRNDRKVECFSLFERYVTLRHFRSVQGRVHSINLFAVSATGCCVRRNLTTSSFGGKETNFFGSKFAIDSSTPLSEGILLLYLTFKSMPKAKF